MRLIPVNRGNRSKALKQVVADTGEKWRNDRQLIIYPEGTRRAPGDEPQYKYGIVELYSQLGMPVVPVAHVAGLFWPRRKFLRYPGTIKAKFLPPIPPGLDREEFMRRLIVETEAGCDALLVEAAQAPGLRPCRRRRSSGWGSWGRRPQGRRSNPQRSPHLDAATPPPLLPGSPGDGELGAGLIEFLDVGSRQLEIGGAREAVDLLDRRGARDRRGDARTRNNPGKRDFCRLGAVTR